MKVSRNGFQGIDSASLCSLVGRYDNPFPTRLLAPIDCSEIPPLVPSSYEYCKPKRIYNTHRIQYTYITFTNYVSYPVGRGTEGLLQESDQFLINLKIRKWPPGPGSIVCHFCSNPAQYTVLQILNLSLARFKWKKERYCKLTKNIVSQNHFQPL